MPATDLLGIGTQYGAESSAGPTDPFSFDVLTGIAWPAVIPTDQTKLGAYGLWPLKLTRSQLCYIYLKVRSWTLTYPGGSGTVTVDNIFNASTTTFPAGTRNPFPINQQSLFAPVNFVLYLDDGAPSPPSVFLLGFQQSLGAVNILQSDGADGYYPFFNYGQFDTPNDASTSSNAGSGSLGTFHLQDLSGNDFATADIRGTAPSGDVTMQVDGEW